MHLHIAGLDDSTGIFYFLDTFGHTVTFDT